MRRDRGFAAIAAVFVLVVLAGLGVALATIFGAQQRDEALDVLGDRAFQAAQAGVEEGLHQALHNSSCPGTASFSVPGVTGFTVTVECVSTQHDDGGTAKITIYQITATSCNIPKVAPPSPPSCPGVSSDNYVERQLRASVCRGEC